MTVIDSQTSRKSGLSLEASPQGSEFAPQLSRSTYQVPYWCMRSRRSAGARGQFASGKRAIVANGFLSHWPSVPPPESQLDDRTARTVLLTQSLLNAATIKVHSLYMREDQRSRHTCLAAACDMFRFGEKRLHGLGYLNHLNPMMGTLWLTACCVLVDEIKRPRPPSQTLSYDEKEVNASLLDGLATLKAFAHGSLLMRKMLLAQ
ncbi:hypothetical protein B0H10DRAFT_1961653 [Mycena sp. CBHHK59/15]|nr:hypothetical protein B0H10DRAFT_1961653 [Mycena sp. CBHHK59/15]